MTDKLPEVGEGGEIEIPLNGEAVAAIRQIRRRLRGAKTDKDVVLHALAILKKAIDKEIQIVDADGDFEPIYPWKE